MRTFRQPSWQCPGPTRVGPWDSLLFGAAQLSNSGCYRLVGSFKMAMNPEDERIFDRLTSTGRVTPRLRHLISQRYNYCSACDYMIDRDRPAFAGYDVVDQPLFLHAKCAEQLMVELATPVYWRDTLNIGVEDNVIVWRYMDFAKFAAMLRQRGLYFPRADQLDDKFEAAAGLAKREPEWDQYYLAHFRKVVVTAPEGYDSPNLTETEIDEQARILLERMKTTKVDARTFYVSCWHANGGESEALWRLYCPPSTVGVAIRTTVKSIWDAVDQELTAAVGRVHYIDFGRSYAMNGTDRIFCKRSSLSHEREIRAVLKSNHPDAVQGRLVSCDLEALIRQVVISPFAPAWFREVVVDLIDRFGFSFNVRPSDLLEEPFF